MRVVLQRVTSARVTVGDQVTGEIGPGLLLLVGFRPEDERSVLEWMVEKVAGLRIFSDAEGKMNLSIEEVGGDLLVVSQFTLYGDTRKGRRPSFIEAAPPSLAIPLYRSFLEMLRKRVSSARVEEGEFGAMMSVGLVNEGPVTLILER